MEEIVMKKAHELNVWLYTVINLCLLRFRISSFANLIACRLLSHIQCFDQIVPSFTITYHSRKDEVLNSNLGNHSQERYREGKDLQ